MKLYKVQLKIESPLVTPLKGDTIWGHVAWGIANHEGEEAVSAFIEDCKNDGSAFIVSSAFPKGCVCRQIPQVKERKEDFSLEDYAKIKALKKEKYESASSYFDLKDSAAELKQTAFVQNISTHNTISRDSGTVQEGGLYSVSELWAKQSDFDIYVLSMYSKERVLELCKWGFENGFGADSSTGKGKVEVVGDATEVKPKLHGNKYMALAPFVVPDLNEIQDLRADVFVRSGKIGGSFVSSLSPYKKTVVLYDEGSVFESDKPIEFIGKLLTNVHSDSRIVQSAFAPVIPIE